MKSTFFQLNLATKIKILLIKMYFKKIKMNFIISKNKISQWKTKLVKNHKTIPKIKLIIHNNKINNLRKKKMMIQILKI